MLFVACCGVFSQAVPVQSSSRTEIEVSPAGVLHETVDDEEYSGHRDDSVNDDGKDTNE